jgi:catechol 2,3-dioxygenase-like lactoylglutathione lyase family enzyme
VAVIGIESLVYGVDDLAQCKRFFEDFGLRLMAASASVVEFEVDEGSRVILRSLSDPSLPQSSLVGSGVREVVWGVDTAERLRKLSENLARDRDIKTDADGTVNHHNLLLLNAGLPFPGFDGQARFHHANFGVEDVDEIMVGANHMERCGWDKSELGLGRHRIDSALFYYLPCPTGGEAEYGADGDCVDDSWVPRFWEEPLFGYLTFAHNMPQFFRRAPAWKYSFLETDSRCNDAHVPTP